MTVAGAPGMAYEISADRLPGVYGGPMGVPMVYDEDTDRKTALEVGRGGTLHLDAAGADPSGVWWVRVRPLADPPAACPLTLRISTQPPPEPHRRR